MAASKIAMASLSLTHFRPLSSASMASVSPSFSSRLVPHPPDLIKWVRTEGGFVHHSLKIAQHGDTGLGLFASDHIPKGSELIVLPHNLPLQFDSDSVLVNLARQVPEELWSMKLGLKLLKERAKIGSFWWPYIGNLPEVFSVPIFFPGDDIKNLQYAPLLYQYLAEELWSMKLGLKLLKERAKVGSFWWPYISNLPEVFSVPIFFPGDDIKNLQYAPLLYQVNKRCRFLLDFEKEVKRTLDSVKPEDHPFGGQTVDASSLGWAMAAVSSRAFRLYGKNLTDGTPNSVPMMLPLIDMCNHSFNSNARIVQEQSAGSIKLKVKVLAETEIEGNVPLTLNYGCLDNDLFLLDYGFVIPSNQYDSIELKYDEALLEAASIVAGISSENFSSPAPWQKLVLSKLNLHGEAALLKVCIGGTEIIDGRLLAALRVLLSVDEEIVQKQDLDVLKSLSAEAPLGVANEIAALRTLIALCVIALGHFPTKIMEDETLLKKCEKESSKLAIQFRIQKKSVIVDVMSNLTRRVKLLSSKAVTQG